jgi:flagellar hook-associated protein 2
MIDNNIIRSLGAGSGVDSGSIVKQLKDIEKKGPQDRLDAKRTLAETQISDFGLISSSLNTLKKASEALTDETGMYSKTAAFTASDAFAPVSLEAEVLTGTYAFDVIDVAAAQSLSSPVFASVTDAVGQGTLTFELGSWDSTSANFELDSSKTGAVITIDGSNNSLQGLRDAVNKADFGVQASIIKDGAGFRLLFTATSGLNNQLKISVAESGGTPTNTDTADLSRFSYGEPGARQMNEDQKGKDARFTVNGLSISRESNKIDDVIEGFTFQLSQADPGKIVTVTISDDKAFAEEKVRGFVEAYNTFLDDIKPAFAFDDEKDKFGSLSNDALGKSVLSRIRGVISQAIPGVSTSDFTALTNVGIRTKLDGTLEIIEKDFKLAFDDNFAKVQSLFAPDKRTTNGEITINSFAKQTVPGDYSVNVTTAPKRGFYTGNAIVAAPPLDTTGKNYTFALSVNGVATGTIALPDATSYTTQNDWVSAVQSLINRDSELVKNGMSVTVSVDSNKLVFTSARFGSSSKVDVTAASANATADLGIAVAVGTAGVDAAGTINGKAAFGFGNVLRPELGEPGEGLSLIIGPNATTATVSYSRGFGGELKELVDQFLSTNGLITTRKTDLESRVKGYDDDQKDLDRRIDAFELRLSRQFRAMETILNGLNTSGSFLDNLFKTLPYTAGND